LTPPDRHAETWRLLSAADHVRLKNSAAAATKVETAFARKLTRVLEEHARASVAALREGRPVPEPEGLEDLLMENAHAAMRAGLLLVEEDRELEGRPPLARLADKKPGAPSSLPELRAWWDRYRKTKKATPRVRKLARDLKARYLEALRKTWEKASVSFRDGEEFDQQQAIAAVTKAAEVGASRGRMIVATETTRYYNTVRREAYDKVDGVTHYLFISVRDHRTTKWCKCRSGLVYAKDSDVFTRETPPIHWNCRSEITPLVKYNPSHRKLIADETRRRENVRCEPLPKGWNK
jgi:SPP1 gp7 family putative phage head morphogenesis protein